MISYYQYLLFTRNEAMISLTVHLCRHPDYSGPLAHYWALLSNPPVLYKFQQPPCVSLRRRSLVNYPAIQLSKCPTTQIFPLFRWGSNNILRLLWIEQAHYTRKGMWVGETNYPDTAVCLTQNQETLLASEAEGYHYHNHNHNYRHQIRRKGQRSKICRAVWHKRAQGGR